MSNNASLRIIADHSRAATFLIADGVVPSNDGRGYVLTQNHPPRLRHRAKLNTGLAPEHFMPEMSDAVREVMGDAYPELNEHAVRIRLVLDEEESRFTPTRSRLASENSKRD